MSEPVERKPSVPLGGFSQINDVLRVPSMGEPEPTNRWTLPCIDKKALADLPRDEKSSAGCSSRMAEGHPAPGKKPPESVKSKHGESYVKGSPRQTEEK